MARPTWQQLIELEPRLDKLLNDAKSIQDDPDERSFCANRAWYGHWGKDEWVDGLKRKLLRLVGWTSLNKGHPILGGCEAYDVAYRTVYGALPDCRNCACM